MAKQTKKQDRFCSFCGRSEHEVKLMLTGIDGNICDQCVEMASSVLQTEVTKKSDFKIHGEEIPKPAQLKAFLDQYVICQDEAKRF